MSEKLRYELTQLWPSEIADQLYCEYKVHLRRTHPEVRVESAALDWGEANHAALAAQAAPVSAEEVERAIAEGKKLALCEWTLEGTFRGVALRGRPDFFAFEGRRAQLVLDFKFSGGDRPYRSQEVQASVYAFLAGEMGFDTSELCYGIVLFPPHARRLGPGDAARAKEDRLRSLQADGTLADIYDRCAEARQRLLARRYRKQSVDGSHSCPFVANWQKQ